MSGDASEAETIEYPASMEEEEEQTPPLHHALGLMRAQHHLPSLHQETGRGGEGGGEEEGDSRGVAEVKGHILGAQEEVEALPTLPLLILYQEQEQQLVVEQGDRIIYYTYISLNTFLCYRYQTIYMLCMATILEDLLEYHVILIHFDPLDYLLATEITTGTSLLKFINLSSLFNALCDPFFTMHACQN